VFTAAALVWDGNPDVGGAPVPQLCGLRVPPTGHRPDAVDIHPQLGHGQSLRRIRHRFGNG
jgi:hypothetical protein